MTVLTRVWVPGHPRTKGSLDPLTMKDTPASRRFRALVAGRVRDDIAARGGTKPHLGPVEVRLSVMIQPPSYLGVPDLARSGATWHQSGDIDKYARLALDAITSDSRVSAYNGGAIMNDAQVVRIVADKTPATPDVGEGMLVQVMAVHREGALSSLAHWGSMARMSALHVGHASRAERDAMDRTYARGW